MIFQYVLPITIVSIVYAKISDKLQKRLIRRQRLTQLECQQKRQLNLIRRTHTMLVSVSLVFGLSWLPLNLLNVISDFNPLFSHDDQLFRIIFAICHLIGCSSACSNPILYGFLNENFRKEMHQVYMQHLSYIWSRLLRFHGPLCAYLGLSGCCCCCCCCSGGKSQLAAESLIGGAAEARGVAAAAAGPAWSRRRLGPRGAGRTRMHANCLELESCRDEEEEEEEEEEDEEEEDNSTGLGSSSGYSYEEEEEEECWSSSRTLSPRSQQWRGGAAAAAEAGLLGGALCLGSERLVRSALQVPRSPDSPSSAGSGQRGPPASQPGRAPDCGPQWPRGRGSVRAARKQRPSDATAAPGGLGSAGGAAWLAATARRLSLAAVGGPGLAASWRPGQRVQVRAREAAPSAGVSAQTEPPDCRQHQHQHQQQQQQQQHFGLGQTIRLCLCIGNGSLETVVDASTALGGELGPQNGHKSMGRQDDYCDTKTPARTDRDAPRPPASRLQQLARPQTSPGPHWQRGGRTRRRRGKLVKKRRSFGGRRRRFGRRQSAEGGFECECQCHARAELAEVPASSGDGLAPATSGRAAPLPGGPWLASGELREPQGGERTTGGDNEAHNEAGSGVQSGLVATTNKMGAERRTGLGRRRTRRGKRVWLRLFSAGTSSGSASEPEEEEEEKAKAEERRAGEEARAREVGQLNCKVGPKMDAQAGETAAEEALEPKGCPPAGKCHKCKHSTRAGSARTRTSQSSASQTSRPERGARRKRRQMGGRESSGRAPWAEGAPHETGAGESPGRRAGAARGDRKELAGGEEEARESPGRQPVDAPQTRVRPQQQQRPVANGLAPVGTVYLRVDERGASQDTLASRSGGEPSTSLVVLAAEEQEAREQRPLEAPLDVPPQGQQGAQTVCGQPLGGAHTPPSRPDGCSSAGSVSGSASTCGSSEWSPLGRPKASESPSSLGPARSASCTSCSQWAGSASGSSLASSNSNWSASNCYGYVSAAASTTTGTRRSSWRHQLADCPPPGHSLAAGAQELGEAPLPAHEGSLVSSWGTCTLASGCRSSCSSSGSQLALHQSQPELQSSVASCTVESAAAASADRPTPCAVAAARPLKPQLLHHQQVLQLGRTQNQAAQAATQQTQTQLPPPFAGGPLPATDAHRKPARLERRTHTATTCNAADYGARFGRARALACEAKRQLDNKRHSPPTSRPTLHGGPSLRTSLGAIFQPASGAHAATPAPLPAQQPAHLASELAMVDGLRAQTRGQTAAGQQGRAKSLCLDEPEVQVARLLGERAGQTRPSDSSRQCNGFAA